MQGGSSSLASAIASVSATESDFNGNFEDTKMRGWAAGSFSAGSYNNSSMGIYHTPPRFTPASYEIDHMKRARAGSISSRLRSASDLEESGIINKNQKGQIKDLIISGDLSLQTALENYELGDSSQLIGLMEQGYLDRRDSCDLLQDLDLKLISVGLDDILGSDINLFEEMNTNGDFFKENPEDDASFHSNFNHRTFNEKAMMVGSLGSDSSLPNSILINKNISDSILFCDNLESFNINVTFEDEEDKKIDRGENQTHGDIIIVKDEPILQERLSISTEIAPTFVDLTHATDSSTIGPLPFESPSHKVNENQSNEQIDCKDVKLTEYSPQFHFSLTNDFTNELHTEMLEFPFVGLDIEDGVLGYQKNSSDTQPLAKREEIDKNEQKCLIGAYSPTSRQKRLERYYEKKKHRVWTKTVKYDVRKNFADSRMRVKGRFVKKDDEALLMEVMALC
mmetsp:Transcript_2655/g.3633  ORF Transcript_2655/g.3633 Transcript_2655/m.3633 type:complete len:452 (+) Transcript_2655:73-1428(+)